MKTTYYLRTLAASQVTKTIEAAAAEALSPAPAIAATAEPEVKACLLNDPTCEACQ
jgi:ribonucleoside-diphosphate reductase alpha chain